MVTHRPPANAAEKWPTTTFVDGVEAAINRAKQIAGDKNVTIASAYVTQQALALGLNVGPAAATTADMQAPLLDRLDEFAAKQDEIRAMLIELQRPPTSS